MQTTTTTNYSKAFMLSMLMMFIAIAHSDAQINGSYSMQITNCASTANRIEFDVMVSNTGSSTLQINSTVIRLTHAAGILPTTGVNTVTIGFVNDGNSIIPLVWPPSITPAFVYTPSNRQFSVSTNTGVYLNGTTCAAPTVAAGATAKLGRYFIQNSQNWVQGQNVGLTFVATSAMIVYVNCNSVVSNAANLSKSLSTPCTLSTPGGCSLVASIQGQTSPTCFGLSNATATATSSGGVGSVSYSWNTSPVQNGATATGLAAGTYIVTATDAANGCVSTASVTITQPNQLLAFATQQGLINCFGGTTNVEVTAGGGTAPYSGTGTFTSGAGIQNYTVTDAHGCTATATTPITQPIQVVASATAGTINCAGGVTSVVVSATGGTGAYTGTGSFTVSAGTHNYSVADANGCTASTSITVTEPSVLSASASATPILCFGGSTTATISASGGTAPYDGTGTYSGTAGTYSYTVTDANGCSTSGTITITEPAQLVASATAGVISCNGGSTTINVSATGGTGSYNGTGTFTVGAGTYSYVVTDANGCSASVGATVTEPAVLNVSLSSTPIACFGGTSSITVSATGGTSPYNGTGTFGGYAAGSHELTVVDANGCTTSALINISEPEQLIASSSQGAAIACFGGSTTVTVSASGGTASYTGTGTFTVGAGTHSYTVTDANGCTATTSITVTQPSASVVASASAGTIACFGGSTTVVVSATGGSLPYSGTGSFVALAGTHSYTVTDANGCSSISTITITEPAQVVASASASPIACFGGNSSVVVSATGGTAPYTGTGTFTVGAGTQTYSVSDANGCSASTTITITQPSQVVVSINATPIACFGGTSTVTVSATGGTGSYTGTGTFTVGAGNLYTYTVSDANGCSASSSVTISQPAQLLAAGNPSGAIACFGGSTSVVVTAVGGTTPYSGVGTFTQFAGTTNYTVTDANECTVIVPVTVSQPTKVEGTTTSSPSGCAGSTGTATVFPTGGTGTYTYLWNNGQTTATATGLAIGVYTVIITDGNGCTGSASATVSGSGGAPLTPGSIAGPASVCRNSTNIVYSVAPVAGAASYSWTLPNGITGTSTTNSITVSVSGNYAGGFICVAAVNPCGTSLSSCMNIPVIATYPSQPTVINGPSIACGGSTYIYSTTSTNALSYTWTVTGNGVSITSGQGTNTIQVSVPVGFGQGSVQVTASNCYGSSAVRGMTITGIPTHSNAVSGPSFVCANNSATYTMPLVPGVAPQNYVWSVTGDAIVSSSSVSASSASATIAFGPTWTTGNVTINVSNTCGSFSRSFAVRSTPIQPGAITGPGSGLCGLSNVGYSIVAVPGATSYTWTVPAGVSIVSTAANGLSVILNFSPAFTSNSADICVTANNACGAGAARCFAVTSRPAVPVVTGPTSVCKSQSAVLYTSTTPTGATSYAWSISGGASLNPSANTATVNFNTATSSPSVLRVNAINGCGSSQPGGLTIATNMFCRTADEMLSTTTAVAYPNPTSGKTIVSFNANNDGKYSMKVLDMIGNVIVNEIVNAKAGINSNEIDLSNAAKGIYMISLRAENGTTETVRLIVE
jgi:hypothetical protein